jgi:molecular chaperone Hsp33
MIGYTLKNPDDSVTIRVDGGGPVGRITAVSDGRGHLKCDITNKIVEIPLNAMGKLDVGGAVGRDGTISVVKDMGLKEPYIGVSELATGEIAEDIVKYYAESEQMPTVCGLGVLVNPDLTVKSAGGFMIQVLPFTPDSDITIIEENLKRIPHVTKLLEDGMTAEEISLYVLEGLEPNTLDEGNVMYHCDCSRQRTERVVKSIGRDELLKIAADKKDTEVECHFCGRKYVFTSDEIAALAEDN